MGKVPDVWLPQLEVVHAHRSELRQQVRPRRIQISLLLDMCIDDHIVLLESTKSSHNSDFA